MAAVIERYTAEVTERVRAGAVEYRPPIPRERFLADLTRLILNYFREPVSRAERG
ncbi:hypothetical protein ABZ412_07700 [Nocardia sp. NPDC005746]|uniref:hypothetical protein n=1 Tax=Nocardia sp. NPDC005746 TaxID=3157062 RepID=UPI00340211F3